MAKKLALHQAIRSALHVPPEMSDEKFLRIWKERSTRVCKPCWELKYCPYGPLVEQSPLLPLTLDVATDHHECLKQYLTTGKCGSVKPLDNETRVFYQACVDNFDEKDYESDPSGEITAMQMAGHGKKTDLTRESAISINNRMRKALETGMDGHASNLTAEQRKKFAKEVAAFDPSQYPESIPEEIQECSC